MNLKLVVASMSVLGLVSCPVFAAANTKHKHHHHKVKHHRQMEAARDYKDMGSMPVPAPVEPACTISQTTMILDEATQNMGRSMPAQCNPGWFNRIAISGGVNIDLGKWGNRNPAYMGENYQRLSLNDAYLNVGANVNDWTKAFASISYMTATTNPAGSNVGEYSAAYANNVTGATGNTSLQLEQAFVTIGNFDQSPIYLQLGKQYQDFSRYEIHSITPTLTQVMSETLATSAKLGFIVPMGFSGDVYVFDDPVAKVGQNSRTTNYGIALNYEQPSDTLGWDIGVAYLYNMIGANDVAYAVQSFTNSNGYNNRIGGVAAYADLNVGPFVLGARYTTAVQRFKALDLPANGVADLSVNSPGANVVSTTASGAKPWAAGVQAAYGFNIWDKNQNVYVGYQSGRQAAGLFIPKSRWVLGYGIDVVKYTNFAIQWDHDIAYNTNNGGWGSNTNLVSLRAAVKFG